MKNSLFYSVLKDVEKAIEYTDSKSDPELEVKLKNLYLSVGKLLAFYRESIRHCAYCGHPDPQVEGINKEYSSEEVICFVLKCRSCSKEDWPGAIKGELMSILN